MGKLGATEAFLFTALVFLLFAEKIFAWVGRLAFPKRPPVRNATPAAEPAVSASVAEPEPVTELAADSALEQGDEQPRETGP